MKKLITTLSALALASTLSFAEDKPSGPPKEGGPGGPGGEGRKRPSPEEMVKRLDTNNDGTVSLEEFKAGPMAQRDPSKAEEVFKRMDKDGDGKLTVAEVKEGRPQRPPGEGGKGGPEGGKRGPKPGGEGAPKAPGQ